MHPRLSVVIPLYNKARYLPKTLKSVLAQSFAEFELIVVDDGSTDGSRRIVEGIGDSRIRYLYQDNAGVSAARNRGVREARTELIAFLDADDEWYPDHLSHLYKLHEDFSAAGLYSNDYEIWASGNSPPNDLHPRRQRGLINYFEAVLGSHVPVWTSVAMVKRDAFEKVGGFPDGWNGEDQALWLKIALNYPVAVSDYVGGIYHKSASERCSQIVEAPDACTMVIDNILKTRADLAPNLRAAITELRCKFAIAHSILALFLGRADTAKTFLNQARDTRRFKIRWRILNVIAHLPSSIQKLVIHLWNFVQEAKR